MDDPVPALGYHGTVNHPLRSGAFLFLSLAAAACSSEPDSGSKDNGPSLPTFQGPGTTTAPATNTMGAAPAPTGAAAPNGESTQVNQLAPAPSGDTNA